MTSVNITSFGPGGVAMTLTNHENGTQSVQQVANTALAQMCRDHKLVENEDYSGPYKNGYCCDDCGKQNAPKGARWNCASCGTDICQTCHKD
jgi:hypothetical protein